MNKTTFIPTVKPLTRPTKATRSSSVSQTKNNSPLMKRKENIIQVNAVHIPEVSKLNDAKQEIDQLETLIKKVISENIVVPQVKSRLDPSIKYIQENFPDFYHSVISYFKTVSKIQRDAVSNQVISTYTLKDSLNDFKSGWTRLCNIIDEYSDVNPPPHLEEITNKFKVIISALDMIHKSNWNQKKRSQNVENSVNSMQDLAENLSESITELFSQPAFPHFDTDLCTAFKNNIKSFVAVLVNVFSNDFLACGMRITDIMKIRTNILADCNDIMGVLSAAFNFTDEMKELQKLKNSINVMIGPIIEKVSQPFSVVKPNVPPNTKKPPPTPTSRRLVRDISTKQLALELYPKFDHFLNTILPILVPNITLSADINENLETLQDTVKAMQFSIKRLTRKAHKFEEENAALKQTILEDNKIHENSTQAMEMRVKSKTQENKTLLQKLKELEHQVETLTQKNDEMSNELSEMKLKGDPTILRKGIAQILDCDLNNENSDMSLIINLNAYIKKLSKCEKCDQKDKTIAKMESLVSDILHERRKIPFEEKINGIKHEIEDLRKNLSQKEGEEIELENTIRSAYFQINKNAIDKEKPVREYLDEIIKRSLRKQALPQAQAHVKLPFADKLKAIFRDICTITNEDPENKLQFILSEDHNTIFDQVSEMIGTVIIDIKRVMRNYRNKIEDLQRQLEKEKERHQTFLTDLGKDFDAKPSDHMIPECLENAKSWVVPYELETQRSSKAQQLAETRLNSLYTRIRGITHDKSPIVDDFEAKFDAIHEMLDVIQDTIDEYENPSNNPNPKPNPIKMQKQVTIKVFDEWKPSVDIPFILGGADSDDENQSGEFKSLNKIQNESQRENYVLPEPTKVSNEPVQTDEKGSQF